MVLQDKKNLSTATAKSDRPVADTFPSACHQIQNRSESKHRLSVESDGGGRSCSTSSTCSVTASDLTQQRDILDKTTDQVDDFLDGCSGYLEPFLHQVGGHGSVLSWDRRTVCKPFSVREHAFYDAAPLEFKEFIPEYRGTIDIGLIKDNSGYLLLNAEKGTNEEGDYEDQLLAGKTNVLLLDERPSNKQTSSMRKCESSNTICKHKSVGRIRLKRSGSLELEVYRRSGRRSFNRAFENSASKRCNGDCTSHDETFTEFPKKDSGSNASCSLHANGDTNASSSPQRSVYAQNPWALECQARQLCKMQRKMDEKQKFILLENLVCNFNFPCILDLKMGFRQHDDDAPLHKRNSQMTKCKNSTSSALGVRMCGMQVYHADSGVFKCYNKYYGRMLTVDGFKKEIWKFLHNRLTFRSDLLPQCIEKLKALKQVIIHAEGYRFYSSSLLIIYDGDLYAKNTEQHQISHSFDNESSGDCSLDNRDSVIVKMIDFEHTIMPEIGDLSSNLHTGYDKGYVDGINNLISILGDLKRTCIDNGSQVESDSMDAAA